MDEQTCRHWSLAVDAEGVAWATLDKSGEAANSLSREVLSEFAQVLDRLDRVPPKGLIISSG